MKFRYVFSQALLLSCALTTAAWADNTNKSERFEAMLSNMTEKEKEPFKLMLIKLLNKELPEKIRNDSKIKSVLLENEQPDILRYTFTLHSDPMITAILRDPAGAAEFKRKMRESTSQESCVKKAEDVRTMKAVGWTRAKMIWRYNNQTIDTITFPIKTCS